MSVVSSEKIFVDPSDEITFIIERILTSDKERIVLVVPQNSIMFSSIVSVQILLRKLLGTKKIMIIVTEDEYGKKIAEKLGFLVVSKVSHITQELWNDSLSRKKRLVEEFNNRFKENEPVEKKIEVNIEETEMEEIGELVNVEEDLRSNPVSDLEIEKENISLNSELVKEVKTINPLIEKEASQIEKLESEEVSINQTNTDLVEDEIKGEKNQEKNLVKSAEREFPTFKKRHETKLSSIGGIEILGGGDIRTYLIEESISNTQINKGEINSRQENIGVNLSSSNNFTNKDFTKVMSKETGLKRFLAGLTKRDQFENRTDKISRLNDNSKRKVNKKRALLFLLIFLVSIFLIIFYLIIFKFSTVNLKVTLKKEDVSASSQVKIDPNVAQIIYNPLTIPGKVITSNKSSLSRTGTADGTGKTGNKAQGTVTLYNFNTSVQVISAGTKLTNSSNNLIYILVSSISLPAAVTGKDGVKTPGKVDDVSISASNFGTNYNISTVVNPINYTIDGFPSTSVSASEFTPIIGGTENNFVSVSADNIKNLANNITPDLQAQILSNLTQLVPDGYQLVQGSITYSTTTQSALPAQDQNAPDKTFNLTMEMVGTGVAISNADLSTAGSYLLINNNVTVPTSYIQSPGNVSVNTLTIPVITNFVNNGKSYSINIASKGSVVKTLTANEIFNNMTGMSTSKANDYLSSQTTVDSFNITYNPSFVPDSLKIIPTEFSRVKISIN